MDYQKALQAVQAGQLDPVYSLVGQETYLQDQFVQAVINQALDQPDDMNVIKMNLRELGLENILYEADSLSFFAQDKVIIVEEAEALWASGQDKLSSQAEQALFHYLTQPNPGTRLIFKIQADNLDKRRKMTKQIQAKTRYVDTRPLDARAVDTYIHHYLKEGLVQLTQEALQALMDRTHYNLSQIMTELDKLANYSQEGQAIDLATVEALVPRTLESNVFELSNAVVALDLAQAVQIYQDLILLNHDPVALHALLVSQFRLFLQVKVLAQEGRSQADMANILGVHPYRVKLALKNSQTLSLGALFSFYQEMIQADYNMKTGVGEPDLHFYLLMTRLMEVSQKK